MRRVVATLAASLVTLALLAPAALAYDNGIGAYGPADDKVATNTGFILIGGFPLLILLLSILQWRLEKRKARRKAHLPARDWAGGW